ncbi:NAD-dependent deacylase [Collibacillus ludicampi]|uniref:protein acetyllysine N-acetyltransferase n=1 Tax=Collibacillus ludicampi TaxID=2771369 RepID=A0AAV4LK65_9BACL|nr:Sir2 family NAD-dependent protein deacetylase [Collibacillus ludicampi]GIM48251.1 NAD-dependent deacylase [Collibacillus ludicampi]
MIEKWKRIIQSARHPLAITGAGISVASGLPTVSSRWRGIPLREIFTLHLFLNEPDRFYRCYREVLLGWNAAKPNPAHLALARWQIPIITMNIDGLHQEAGSPHVIELHGNLRELICLGCDSIFSSDLARTDNFPLCPSCQGRLKPNIVLVGEEVHHFSSAVDWVGRSDVLLIIGTRLEMAPCNQLPKVASRTGATMIRINQEAERIVPAILNIKPNESVHPFHQ